MFQETILLASKLTSILIDSNISFNTNSHVLDDVTKYRRLIRKLIYLTVTRPDIIFAVIFLSQFVSNPTVEQYQCLLRLLRYLKNAPDQGIFLSSISDS